MRHSHKRTVDRLRIQKAGFDIHKKSSLNQFDKKTSAVCGRDKIYTKTGAIHEERRRLSEDSLVGVTAPIIKDSRIHFKFVLS